MFSNSMIGSFAFMAPHDKKPCPISADTSIKDIVKAAERGRDVMQDFIHAGFYEAMDTRNFKAAQTFIQYHLNNFAMQSALIIDYRDAQNNTALMIAAK